MTTKTCSLCKEEKFLSKFHIDRRSSSGRASRCKSCAKKESKTWYEKSDKYRQTVREGGLKHRFGITLDDYYQMLQDQNNLCAICKLPSDKNFHVDHNHDTGEIRGLLCKQCNHGLGNFKDSKEFLKNAIEYLDRNTVGNI